MKRTFIYFCLKCLQSIAPFSSTVEVIFALYYKTEWRFHSVISYIVNNAI